MKTGKKSWLGIEFLIFGEIPLKPMEIERKIAAALPYDEIRLESFEDYNEALNYCNCSKKVGFFIFLRNEQTSLSFEEQVFKNFSVPYLLLGWPTFRIVVYENRNQILNAEVNQNDQTILSYLDSKCFSSKLSIQDTFAMLWDKFIDRTFKNFFSSELIKSLTDCTKDVYSEDFLSFYTQTFNLLSQNLDLSWKEILILRIAPYVFATQLKDPSILKSNKNILELSNFLYYKNSISLKELIDICENQKQPLGTRVFLLLMHLSHIQFNSQYAHDLEIIASKGVNGNSAIFRTIQQNFLKLLDFPININKKAS